MSWSCLVSIEGKKHNWYLKKKILEKHVFTSQCIPSVPATGASFCKSYNVTCHLWILPQPQQEFLVKCEKMWFFSPEWLCSESTAVGGTISSRWEHPSNKSQGTEGNFHSAAHLSLGKLPFYQADIECIPWRTSLITWVLCCHWFWSFWSHHSPAF